MKKDLIRQLFFQRMDEYPAHVIAAPGRINLIGEHTDYNGGYVLPATIDRYIYIGISKSHDDGIVAEAIDLQERFEAPIDQLEEAESHWELLLKGAVEELKHLGPLNGFYMVIMSDLPQGSGLSSSSALCCGMIAAISKLFELNMDRMTIAKTARKIETEYAGISCGFMDQFIICHGRPNQAALLNCNSLEHEWLDIDPPGYQFLLLNSNVPRQLHNSAYNERKRICQEVAQILIKDYNDSSFLTEINLHSLNNQKDKLTKDQYEKALFVLEENERVHEFVLAMTAGKVDVMGQLLLASHKGLRDLYEVSCEQVDFLVMACEDIPQVAGARMIGGGFGGCVLCLIESPIENQAFISLNKKYSQRFGLDLELIEFTIGEGLIY